MKYIDAFRVSLESYALEGLERATRTNTKHFVVGWDGDPFFCRVFNLARYFDDVTDNEDCDFTLDLPPFPMNEIQALAMANPGSGSFFENEEGTPIFNEHNGWDCAFDCGPYMEAGQWVKLMIDDQIRLLEEKLGKDPAHAGIEIEICGHDGLYAKEIDYYLNTLQELRTERGYSIEPALINSFIALFNDKPEAGWMKAVQEA